MARYLANTGSQLQIFISVSKAMVCLRRVAANRGQLMPRLARPLFERRYLPYSDIELTPPDEQEDQLETLGAVVHEYVSHNTYLCGYKGSDLAQIRALEFVVWADVYLNTFVIQPTLKSAAPTTQTFQVHKVDVIFHHDVDTHAENLRIALATAAHVDADDLDIGPHKVRLAVQEQYLEGLAAIDDVVAVADIGFDKGSTQDVHEAFTGRVKKLYPLGKSTSGTTGHPDGHGTQVCSSVLGDGNPKSMGGRIRGVAAKSTLVVQSLLDGRGNLGGIPDDLTQLFIQPYNEDNARIHTNYWGSTSGRQLPYDASSSEIDRFVWEHPDIVVLFAAGNDGIDIDRNGVIDDRLSSSCKELHHRRRKREPPPEHSYQVWHNDLMANHPDGVAAFSSRGLTKEGRIKLYAVAPGTGILSTRSHDLLNPGERFGHSDDPNYWFLAGTSMATPLVAGAVAVLRECLTLCAGLEHQQTSSTG
uniref:Kp-43 peptidase n=1 Tax=Coccidioides posadasii RMSCC 3488 TaxID=454284 RepID=A0A0J6F3M9_COCPO|nr:kp-43 peptidase [Coccidioides posadasii RMSCC 3488]